MFPADPAVSIGPVLQVPEGAPHLAQYVTAVTIHRPFLFELISHGAAVGRFRIGTTLGGGLSHPDLTALRFMGGNNRHQTLLLLLEQALETI